MADTGYVKLSGIIGDSMVNYTLELDKLFNSGIAQGTDIWAIHSGYVSVSLLRFETDHLEVSPEITACIQTIGKEFFGVPPGVK